MLYGGPKHFKAIFEFISFLELEYRVSVAAKFLMKDPLITCISELFLDFSSTMGRLKKICPFHGSVGIFWGGDSISADFVVQQNCSKSLYTNSGWGLFCHGLSKGTSIRYYIPFRYHFFYIYRHFSKY